MPVDKTTGSPRQKRSKPRQQTDRSDTSSAELKFALKLTPRARAIRYGNEIAADINRYEQQQQKPRAGKKKDEHHGLIDAIIDTPGSILHSWERYGKTAGRVAEDVVAKPAIEGLIGTSYGLTAPQPRFTPPIPGAARGALAGATAATRIGSEALLGPDLTRSLESSLAGKNPLPGKRGQRIGLTADIAMGLSAEPLRIGRAAVAAGWAAKSARTLREGRRAATVAFEAAMEAPALTPQLVTKGRQWAALRKIEPRGQAHIEIDNLVDDELVRRRMKDQIDGHVYQVVKSLPTGEREGAAVQIYEKVADDIASAPRFPVPGFEYALPQEEGLKHLNSFMRNEGKGGTLNPPVLSRGMENGVHGIDPAGHQVVGEITPADWVARTEHSVEGDPELGLRLANWYRELGPFFHTFFGDDADAIIRGFAVSQANASPAGGLTNVLRVRDKLLRGEEIKRGEISTVSKSIEAAYKGEHVTEGMQAKLHDFANSLEGRQRRTWTNDDIRGGKPTAVDIHAQRDLGYIDPKILATLRHRHGLPVAHLQLEVMERKLRTLQGKPKSAKTRKEIAAQRAAIEDFKQTDSSDIEEGVRSGLVLDNPKSSASGARYDSAVRKYQEITDHLNEIGLWGKTDWEPSEVQALGWSAIQRLHGVVPEDAAFAIQRNTTEIALEILKGKSRMGEYLTLQEQADVTRTVVDQILPALVEQEGAFLRDVDYGLGAYHNEIAPTAQIKIVASPEQVDRIVDRAARMFDQYDVWGVRSGVTVSAREGAGIGRAAVEIDSPAFTDPETVQSFWGSLRAAVPEGDLHHFEGFSQIFKEDGTPAIRVISNRGPLKPSEADGWRARFLPHIERAAEAAGIDRVGYASTNVEVRAASAVATGAGQGARVGGTRGRVRDPLAAEAGTLLRDAVERAARPAAHRRVFGGVTVPNVRHGPIEAGRPMEVAHEFAMFPPDTPREGMRDLLYPKPKSIHEPPSLPPEEREAAMEEIARLGSTDRSPEEEQRYKVLVAAMGLRHDVPLGAPIHTPPGGPPNLPPRGTIGGAPDPDLPGGTPEAAQDFAAARRIQRRGIQGSKATTTRQEALRAPERSRRAGAMASRLEEGEGSAAFRRAGEEARGKYPALNFKGFDDLTPEGLEALIEHVRLHPNLLTWEKYRVYKSLVSGVRGKVPTPSEVKLMERAFGKAVAHNINEAAKTFKGIEGWAHMAAQIYQMPRALMSSFDLSAPFRQGLMVGVRPRYQRIFWSNMAEMHKMWGSTATYEAAMGDIMERANYGMYQIGKLQFTDLGEDMAQREELFMSNLAERIPGVGHGVRASNRAYVGFLNKTRADVFDLLLERAQAAGVDVRNEHFLESLGRFVNSSTGRGTGKQLEKHAVSLTSLLWSPRLLWSRLNFLNPMYYYRLHPYVRKEALRSAFALTSTISAVLGLAAAGGASVEWRHPNSANFAKIKVGDTRIDVLGGFQQPVRLLWQIGSGRIISSTTGEEISLSGGFGKNSPLSTALRFVRSKLNPSASLIVDLLDKQTFEGDPISYGKLARGDWDTIKVTLAERVAPLLLMDSFEVLMEGRPGDPSTWKIDNPGAALANFGIGMYGIGTQTYGATGAQQGGGGAPQGFNLGQRSGGFNLGGGGGGGGGFNLGG